MVELACPLCEESRTSPLLTGRDLICDTAEQFTLVRCEGCGLVYLDPRPSAETLAESYSGTYRQWQETPASGILARVRRMGARRKVAAVRRYAAPGRLLDIGCGGGDFLLEAGRGGWRTCGTEFDDAQAKKAAAYCGADVRAGDPAECGFADGSCDVVTMWHVLEHMPEPLDALEHVRRLLAPGGLLVVGVPDSGSWAARLFKHYWAGYDIPRHLYDFSLDTLTGTLERAGFRVLEKSYFMGTYDSVRLSLEFLVQDRVRSSLIRKGLLWLLGSPLARLVMTPAAMLAQRAGKGSVVTVFATKAA